FPRPRLSAACRRCRSWKAPERCSRVARVSPPRACAASPESCKGRVGLFAGRDARGAVSLEDQHHITTPPGATACATRAALGGIVSNEGCKWEPSRRVQGRARLRFV